MRKVNKQAPTASQRITSLNSGGTYEGKELHRNPGIPAERFEAFSLPSLMGGKLVYPKERK